MEMNLKEISEERADDKNLSEATSPVPSLPDVLKQVLAKKEIAQIAYLKALNSPDIDESEADRLRDNPISQAICEFQSLKVILDDIANGIREEIPKFQQYVNNLKSNGYEVIGYIKCLVDKIYVSPMSHAGEPFSSRDVNYDSTILRELNKAEGTTQGNALIAKE
ncbi:hypothetical protein [Parasitella parasitica]|uniref:Uncharacterized protein n=1 Tax=Parasitella parasitica TaxID=35722 RepID=A0A0B7N0S7_9FUNG|nr:hypothetical protein [Parasitella parasitica]